MWSIGFLLDPTGSLTVPVILAVGFILGLLHGATPDEHTWPITFSYSVGSYSSRGGFRAGLTFSGVFTLQLIIFFFFFDMGMS